MCVRDGNDILLSSGSEARDTVYSPTWLLTTVGSFSNAICNKDTPQKKRKMKKVVWLFGLLFLVSCKQDIQTADVKKMNGYWEIDFVDMPDGTKKEYKVNESVDYFELKDLKGFRKKVYPQLDGKYLVNDIKENVEITTADGRWKMKYTTPYSAWSEEIIEIRDSVLVIENDAKLKYHYKRLTPFSLK